MNNSIPGRPYYLYQSRRCSHMVSFLCLRPVSDALSVPLLENAFEKFFRINHSSEKESNYEH